MEYKQSNLNEQQNILNLDYLITSKEDAYIILNCIENAIKAYDDPSENDLLGMDESDLELCKEFIRCFESIYKNIEKFIIRSNEERLNLKINSNEIEALQNAFELYSIDTGKKATHKNHIKTLEIYDKIKKVNCEILNKTNPKYMEMLNTFENTFLK